MALGEGVHDQVLRAVGVLILVDQDVVEPRLVLFAGIFEIPQNLNGLHQQIVEIECAALMQRCLIALVEQRDGIFESAPGVVGIVLGRHQLLFGVRHLAQHGLGPDFLVLDPLLAQTSPNESELVGAVVNDEIGRIADALDLAAQDAYADAVEGPQPDVAGRAAENGLDPVTHLARGLVGEGDR